MKTGVEDGDQPVSSCGRPVVGNKLPGAVQRQILISADGKESYEKKVNIHDAALFCCSGEAAFQ